MSDNKIIDKKSKEKQPYGIYKICIFANYIINNK